MMRSRCCFVVLGLALIINFASTTESTDKNDDGGILDCIYEKNGLVCAKERADRELDRIETEVTGEKSNVTFSQVLEEAGAIAVDGTRSLLGFNDDNEADSNDNDDNDDGAIGGRRESRKHKFGKKKKKTLQKLFHLAMLVKAKISLILQLISTHFQFKFFAIAILSLLINAARFWIDIKKSHHPAKVIYYEHAQHQHHYEHDQDDHGGYWGRSSDVGTPDDLAYSAYAQEH